MNILKNKIQTIGYIGLFRLVLSYFLSLFGVRTSLNKKRYLLSLYINSILKSTIISGHYKGMLLPATSNWNSNERGCILLGFYEKEVVSELSKKPSNYCNLIVLGAGDGLHAVGAIFTGLYSLCIAYESSPKSRILINQCANLNFVSDRVEIFDEAKLNFYKFLSKEVCENSVILVDIEGAEFRLLDKPFFIFFRKSIIIVENHSFLFPQASEVERQLIINSAQTHNVKKIKTGARSFENLEILDALSDNERWLLCSEGRGQSMNWLRFDPKNFDF